MTRAVDRGRARMFLRKAEEFLRAARRNRDAGDWNTSASASVHAAVLAGDSLTAAALGVRSSGGHQELVPLVARALGENDAATPDVRKRLSRLLDLKRIAEYEDRPITAAEAAACLKDAERIIETARMRLSKPR